MVELTIRHSGIDGESVSRQETFYEVVTLVQPEKRRPPPVILVGKQTTWRRSGELGRDKTVCFLDNGPPHHSATALGPQGVGRHTVKTALIQLYPDAYATCVPHTTRAASKCDVPGETYQFTTR